MFKCLEGCSDCCGCTVLPKELFLANLDIIDTKLILSAEHSHDESFVITTDKRCIFLDRKTHKCRVYEHRPNICRLFGTGLGEDGEENVLLYCPHQRPNGNKWSPAKKKHLERRVSQVTTLLMEKIQCPKGMKNK